MDFLSEPCLTVPKRDALEVGSELLINCEFNIFFHKMYFLHAFSENVRAKHSEQNHATNHEERKSLVTRGPHSVVDLNWNGLIHEGSDLGLEDLHASHAPVTEEEHEKRTTLH